MSYWWVTPWDFVIAAILGIGTIIVVALFCLGGLTSHGIHNLFARNQQARGAVLCRRSGFWVVFDLGPRSLELKVPEGIYASLAEGQKGLLTWRGDFLLSFEEEERKRPRRWPWRRRKPAGR